MPSITGYTATRTQAIEDAIITSAAVIGGHLIFTRHDGSTYDAGDIRGGEQIPHTKVQTVTSGASGTTATGFVNFPVALAVSGFQKYRADTKLVIHMDTDVYNSDVFGVYEVAVLIGSTHTVIFSGYGHDSSKSGIKEITGLAAGTYTITGRYRRGVSGTAYQGHSGTRTCLQVTETF